MKGRPRSGREHRRAMPVREAFDVVLIVCEGSKTEPAYFQALCDDLRLSSANVLVVDDQEGRSPSTVVGEALKRFREQKSFDKIFCVFDRDSHEDYDSAVSRCNSLRQVNSQAVVCKFIPITSNPSFEYWVYLHFHESAAPVVAAGGKSNGGKMLSELKIVYPSYSKANSALFEALKPRIADAARRARRINALGHANPHTKIVELVGYLAAFRKGRQIEWVEEFPVE